MGNYETTFNVFLQSYRMGGGQEMVACQEKKQLKSEARNHYEAQLNLDALLWGKIILILLCKEQSQ